MTVGSSLEGEELIEGAKKVLEGNWTGKFTIPSATLYPHMWSWDSCFIAIGNSYFNSDRAMQELKYLFDAQWKNGMIPHIVFNEKEKTYFPTAEFYEIGRSPNAPKHIGTSGMTQPPVHAIACFYIHNNSNDKEQSKNFLRTVYPNLLNFHRYLMTERDPEKSGLVTLFHPWESGRDDSPVWDDALARITVTDLPKFERLDVIAVGGAIDTIPTNEEYDKFIYLIELMKLYNYDEKLLYEKFPFKIKDVGFSGILYVANRILSYIADLIGEDAGEILEWISRTEQNFHKYFSLPSNRGSTISDTLFYDYDLVIKDRIIKRTVSSLAPLYSGLVSDQEAKSLVKWISDADFCAEYDTIASTDEKESYFKPVTYWRGPIWINTNWALWLGLLRYGYTERAEQIRQGVFKLVQNQGFREYYDPTTGQGLGGKNFSWTAALVIDMIRKKNLPFSKL
jgi:glycogen debranching enzyme